MNRILNNRNRLKSKVRNRGYLKRNNKDPMTQGALRRFAELFIFPFLKHKPQAQTIESFYDSIFCVSERTIERYKVLTPFRIGGACMEFPNVYYKYSISLKSNERRETYIGQHIWVRRDKTQPDRIDVELVFKNGRSMTYRLRQCEFTNIAGFVIPHPYRCHLNSDTSWQRFRD